MAELLSPKEISVPDVNGTEKTFIISKFPAVAGREIIAKYPLSGLPKLGDYEVNEETMLKLMSYVAVKVKDAIVKLDTRALIDNHVRDWEQLARVEIEMFKYNTSFFREGAISTFLGTIGQKVLQSIAPMLIPLSQRLLEAIKQHTNNLPKNTP